MDNTATRLKAVASWTGTAERSNDGNCHLEAVGTGEVSLILQQPIPAAEWSASLVPEGTGGNIAFSVEHTSDTTKHIFTKGSATGTATNVAFSIMAYRTAVAHID